MMKDAGSQQSAGANRPLPKSMCDHGSEISMLPEDQQSIGKDDHGITRTTLVSVTADDKSMTSRHQQDNWA